MKKIKILHVFGIMNRGGAELRTLELLSFLDNQIYEHHFLVLSGMKGSLDDEMKTKGYEIKYLNLKSVKFIISFLKLLSREKYDIVHSNVFFFSGMIQLLARLAGVRSRISHIRSTGDGKGDNFLRKMYRILMKHLLIQHSTKIAGVSKSVLQASFNKELTEHREKFIVMYNGFDLSRFSHNSSIRLREALGLPDAAKVFIHIGRFDPSKNHEKVLSVFKEIENQDKQAYLLLVGKNDTSMKEGILGYIRESGLSEKVLVLGIRKDVEQILRESDCLIFPSIREGLPGVLLEACFSGVPAIASNIPSNIEVAGFFPYVQIMHLDAGDKEWAEACFRMVRQAERVNYKQNANQGFGSSPFNIENAVRKYTELLDQSS